MGLTRIPAMAASSTRGFVRSFLVLMFLRHALQLETTTATETAVRVRPRPSGTVLPTNNFFFAHAPRNFPSGTARHCDSGGGGGGPSPS